MKIIVIANVVSISGMHQRLEAIKRLVSSRLVKLPLHLKLEILQ